MTRPDRPGDPSPDNGVTDVHNQQAASVAARIRGPVRSGERALAPDLARGFMLLLIALANTVWYLWAVDSSGLVAHPLDGSAADRIVQGVLITVVDGRTYPMFAFLFGYGMVQMWNRQRAAGATEKDVRALLRRRNLWLLVFGFVHAALLWFGDILGAYGFVGLVFGWLFLRRADRTLLVWATVLAGLLTAVTALALLGALVAPEAATTATSPDPASGLLFPSPALNSEEDYLTSVVLRVVPWLFLVVAQGLLTLTIPTALLLAFWAARRRILEEPGSHLGLLRTVAFVGIPLGWLGGLLHALHHLGLLDLPQAVGEALLSVASATGLATGVGYVALFGLISHRLSRRAATGPAVTALTAVGKRSLSSYLAQSVLCAPVLAAWGFGLGAHLHSATMALYAVGVWLATVVLAYLQERAGQRGPAEVLLRRLAYRTPARR
ncbi:DUF418 domain-containing protein [Thermobifida halotolerans]|uniref:DUF418 domain-containing protein n=1 Tax=Thermobifida halotolerans TaxID=483545 RepID=A0A399G591_9ACTN|nr:DUF418 domain-containing protein [Thermobifida halotolerans]UOE19701.1 DUF418 domain-containing protein [Thermobifida halotolerans]